MFEDTKIISMLYPFLHIALLNDFGSFALCMSDRLFESAHCSTDTPTLFVVMYPQCTVAVEIFIYYNVDYFFVQMQGVGIAQVVVCTWSVQQHHVAPL